MTCGEMTCGEMTCGKWIETLGAPAVRTALPATGKCAGVPVRPEGRGSTGARDGRVYRSRAIKASRAARVSTSASWRAGTSYSSRASS